MGSYKNMSEYKVRFASVTKALLIMVIVAFGVVFHTAMANAQSKEAIAVVVNDEIITYGDVYDRIDVTIKSSNLPNTKEFRARVTPQIVDALITEQLQLQEATKEDIGIAPENVKSGFGQIASQNKLELEQFMSILKRQGVPIVSMARQIESQMAWGQVVQKKLRSQANVTDQDINAEIDRMRRLAGKSEYMVAEIFLPVQDDRDDAKRKALADRLVGQLREGAPFASLARQFSASAGAPQGGVLGWVNPYNVAPEIAVALEIMEKGQVSAPIRTDRGYHIMQLRDERILDFADPDDVVLSMKELVLPVSDPSDFQTRDQAMVLGKALTGCIDIELKAEGWAGATVRSYELRVGELSGDAQTKMIATNIAIPLMDDAYSLGEDKVLVKMICGRDMPAGTLPDREVIRQKIGLQRLDVLARSYLRDLRSQAYIERRI
jgi:peptidyl-prolyl cis-trans isomerase SurA